MATAQDTHGPNVSAGAGVLLGAGAATPGVLSSSRPLIGVALCVAASLGLWHRADPGPPVGDGIDRPSPADAALGVIGIASAVGFPALVAADGPGCFTWTGLPAVVALAVAGVYLVLGGLSLVEPVRGRQP
ncbi:MAG: hypothetical protein ACI9CA_002209 [Natronomonas sp.]|jgi:hypothetical protein